MTVRTGFRTIGSVVAALALALGMAACSGGDKNSELAEDVAAAGEVAEQDADEASVEKEEVEEAEAPTDGVVAEYGVPFETELLTIEFVGTGESNTGSPNYKVEITNKSDQKLKTDGVDFTVNGEEAIGYVDTRIEAGETKTDYFSFGKSVETGADLVDVVGVIQVKNEDSEVLEEVKVYYPDWEEGVGQ